MISQRLAVNSAFNQLLTTTYKGDNMTRNQMAEYTTAELVAYVERKDEQYKKAPAFIRRTSFSNWNNTSAAICAEIQNRILNK